MTCWALAYWANKLLPRKKIDLCRDGTGPGGTFLSPVMACNMNLPQNQRHPPHEKKEIIDVQYTTKNEQWMERMSLRLDMKPKPLTLEPYIRKKVNACEMNVIKKLTSKFIKMRVMIIKKIMKINHVTRGTFLPSALKISSKSNSPIIITPVFTMERAGF